MISKEREIFKNIYNERLDRIGELTKKINYDYLKFVTQSSGYGTDFTKVEDPVVFLNDIRTNKITQEEAKKYTRRFQ